MVSYQNVPDDASGRVEYPKSEGIAFTLPLHRRYRPGKPGFPAALVASSDENVLREVADIVLQCGLTTYLASTVDESKRILERQRVSLVVCDDRLADGKYGDILGETARLQPKTPVIVLSPTGDWPDYLKAINAGAFDFLAYPPIREDFERTIQEGLTTQRQAISKDEQQVLASVEEMQ
jgi:DNA-binding NtrC family response regulator